MVIFDCDQPSLVKPRLVDDNELRENIQSLDSFANMMTKTSADKRMFNMINEAYIHRISKLLLVSILFTLFRNK